MERSDIDHFRFRVRNVYSAQNQFPVILKLKEWSIERGNPWERAVHGLGPCLMNRETDDHRRMLRENFSSRTPSSSSQERRFLREELWRQQKDFREVHQQSLTEMKELRNFQSSTFDTLARRKLIEDQNTILEISGSLQELQNEVNCMNDSKDFQDAESVRSGNSHVTS